MKFLQKSCISKNFRLYFMKRASNGEKAAVTEHFFMRIGGNMVSEHEMQQIGSDSIDWVDPDGVTLMPKLIDLKEILSFITVWGQIKRTAPTVHFVAISIASPETKFHSHLLTKA